MPKTKPKWKLIADYPITEYQCGARAGDRVKLRREIVVHNADGKVTGDVHREGEIWTVVSGAAEPPIVVWLRCADGNRRTWDDDAALWDWFEKVNEHEG